MVRIACIGECMVELTHRSETGLELAYGGDTLNTALYLARLTRRPDVAVDYVTALGDDAYSDAMLRSWREEGIGTGLVARLPGRLPGLYTIRTDEFGERSFTYWRGEAAARDLLRDRRAVDLKARLAGCDLLYLSGVTLAILDAVQRRALLEIVDSVRAAGGKVAFDDNFRPAAWVEVEEARTWFKNVLQRTDIALPSLDDERALFGCDDPVAVATRLHGLGVAQVVVKLGPVGCYVSAAGLARMVETTPVDAMVDSTAAGDSFNAAYLAAILSGRPPDAAARAGHRLARLVVCHRGAVIPRSVMADLMPGSAWATGSCDGGASGFGRS